MNPWLVGDRIGMVVAIEILEKSLGKFRYGINYLQFNTFCQLQVAVSYVYSATSPDHERRY